MMKIPGNNGNGTEEMWETFACRGEERRSHAGEPAGSEYSSPPSPVNQFLLLTPSGLLHVAKLFFPCSGEPCSCCSGFTGP